VLEEAGLAPPPYRTVTRRLRVFARESWRQQISAACAAHARLGPASLVLYDCSTRLEQDPCLGLPDRRAQGSVGRTASSIDSQSSPRYVATVLPSLLSGPAILP
jgi:hypothetical protein